MGGHRASPYSGNIKNNVGAGLVPAQNGISTRHKPFVRIGNATTGITLIALVITIIILLILAGIAISLTIGKNGIINIAKQAGKNYIDAEADEKAKLEELYSSILVATNGDSQITISMEDLNSLISGKVREEVQKAVWGESVTPTGTIIAQMGNEAPAGYINCDGTIYNILEYKQLAEYIKGQFGSYNYFGGDGTTTFAVPDLRGEFLRGTGTNSHTNQGSGAVVGKHQDATNLPVYMFSGTDALNIYGRKDGGAVMMQNYDAKFLQGVLNAVRVKGSVFTSTEMTWNTGTTRPTNTSVLYCIKY